MKKTSFRDEYKIFVVSIVAGLSVIVVDSALDAFIFDEESFLCSAILKVSTFEIYYRSVILGVFMVYGTVVSRLFVKRRKAEEALRISEERFRKLFIDNPEPAVCLDQSFHILDVNPRFAALFGYSLDEIKGKRINDVVVPKEKMEEAEMLDRKAMNGLVYHDSVRKTKDGSLIPVSMSAAPLIVNDQLLGYVAVYKDISELKKKEHELAIINEKLHVVGGLTRHDVRNKLSAIVGNAYLAKKELAGNGKVLGYLGEIETAVNHVVEIFDFAKTYEMLGVEELAYVDVEKAVNDTVSLFPSLKDIKVMNDCHGLTVLADSLLRQLFYNLIDNSLKHGEKVSQIRVHHEEGKDGLKLFYEDDGVGVPQGVRPRLFAEGYTTGKGSGYGLYLVKRMMNVYGWTIQETGTQSKGAKFVMTIPKTNPNGKKSYVVGR